MDEKVGVELTEKAWQMIETLLETGELVLGNGTRMKATVKDIQGAAQFVASRQALRDKGVVLLDDLRLERTDGKET